MRFASVSSLVFILALGGLDEAFAFNNLTGILEQTSCNGCHGVNSPNRPASQSFAVIDPLTNAAVTAYTPGKVYRLEIKFTNPSNTSPWKNAYRLMIAETSTGTNLRAGSIINSGTIGVVTDEGPTIPQRNARIITSANRQAADNLSLEWQAPNDGRVRFRLYRMESNNNSGVGGDRVSQSEESFTMLSDASEGPDEGGEDPIEETVDPIDQGSNNPGGAYQFGENLQAACGSLRGHSQSQSWMFLLGFAALMILLQSIKRSSSHFQKSGSKHGS
jgi:hypothetical protein